MIAKEKLKSLYAEYHKGSKWFTTIHEIGDGDLLDFLDEGDIVYEEDEGGSRWWNNIVRVSKIENTYFSYGWAETTGDSSIWDVGWEFDWSTLEEVEPYTETITVTKYRIKS